MSNEIAYKLSEETLKKMLQKHRELNHYLGIENSRMRKALVEAEKMFRWYGDLHAAKPDMEKAKRNYEMADKMKAALPPAKEGKGND